MLCVRKKIHIPTREEEYDFFAKEVWEKDPEEELMEREKIKEKEEEEKKEGEQSEIEGEKTDETKQANGKW